MPNTYTQLHIHAVFTVKNRASLIDNAWKDELYKYITGIIQQNGHKLLAIGGISDHIHLLFGMRPSQSLSDLMKDVKGCSSQWINDCKLVNGKFSWQGGFGAFSYSRSQIPRVIRYIQNQEEHHRKTTFIKEYKKILRSLRVDYDDKYLFNPVE